MKKLDEAKIQQELELARRAAEIFHPDKGLWLSVVLSLETETQIDRMSIALCYGIEIKVNGIHPISSPTYKAVIYRTDVYGHTAFRLQVEPDRYDASVVDEMLVGPNDSEMERVFEKAVRRILKQVIPNY